MLVKPFFEQEYNLSQKQLVILKTVDGGKPSEARALAVRLSPIINSPAVFHPTIFQFSMTNKRLPRLNHDGE